ncbi:hypothetical protein MRX96_022201 [Rhipicephalus microplus]
MADGLSEGFPSTLDLQKEPRPATYCSKQQQRCCTQGRPADQARRVPPLPPAHVPGQGDSKQPRACCPNLRSRPRATLAQGSGQEGRKTSYRKSAQ